jgi:hypothetical protein
MYNTQLYLAFLSCSPSPFISLYCTQLYLLAFNWTLSRSFCTPVSSTRLPFNLVLSRSLSYSAVLICHLIYSFFFSFHIANVFSCIKIPKYGYVFWAIFTTFFTIIKLLKFLHIFLTLSSSTFIFWPYVLRHLAFWTNARPNFEIGAL